MKIFNIKYFLKIIFYCSACITFFTVGTSCSKNEDPDNNTDTTNYNFKNGLFIINEGLFNHGNSSIAFYNPETSRNDQDIFSTVNLKPLGDVGFSMVIQGDTGFIVVNNSGTIEVVDIHNMKSIKTIEGIISPRYILPVSKSKAYISSLLESKLFILDMKSLEITGNISTGRTLEQMIKIDDQVFAASWSQLAHPDINNNKVLIINPTLDALIDSITVTKEPNSMAVDKDQNLWVLCSGGYNNEEEPALIKINPQTRSIDKTLNFTSDWAYPSRLTVNKSGDQLYYIDYPNIYRADIQAVDLPVEAFVDGTGKSFYALCYDSENDVLIASDAKDYQQNGSIYILSSSGAIINEFSSGVIPGFILPFYVKDMK